MKQIKPAAGGNPEKRRHIRVILKKLIPIAIVLGLLISLALFLTTLSSSSVINYIISGTGLNSDEGRINVLLLGIPGGGHDGVNLTDTILVASYSLKTKRLHLISIPRDLWLPPLRSKVNAAYQKGLSEGDGLDFAKTVMGNIVGLRLHYSLRVDFKGFEKIIDALEGVDVEVEETFDDYLYPIEGKEEDLCGFLEEEREFSEEEAKQLNIESGKRKVFISPEGTIATDSAEEDKGTKYFTCRYEHLHFDKGLTHMDGPTALKFVRSRHGTNNEGSDFARSARQKKIIDSVKNKVLSLETLTNPQKLTDLLKALGESIDTDISLKDIGEFYRLSKDLEDTIPITIDDSKKEGLPDNRKSLLVHPVASSYGGSYVLISEDDDFSIIHQYIERLFISDEQNESSTSARTGY